MNELQIGQWYSLPGVDDVLIGLITREEFLSYGEEFSYIFTSAGWVCYDMNEFNDKSPELTEIPSGALAV